MNPNLIGTIIGILAGVVTIITGIFQMKTSLTSRKTQPALPPPQKQMTLHHEIASTPLLSSAGVQKFVDNDATYKQWLSEHSQGFVINTARKTSPDYIILHKATCSHICNFRKEPGEYTERGFIKICADDVNSLREWVKQHGRTDGTFSKECSFCKPI